MKTFYFSLVAKNADAKLDVRRVGSVKAVSADHAEANILLDHSWIWLRGGWSINLILISKQCAEAMGRCFEAEEVPA